MEIPAASISQIKSLRNGAVLAVDDDVCGVAKELHEIDPNLKLQWSEFTGLFAVIHFDPDTLQENLVFTAPECDQRIVQRIKEISDPNYDFAAELDKLDARARKAYDDAMAERFGDAHERLAHAIRKDLKKGTPARPGQGVYVPPDAY